MMGRPWDAAPPAHQQPAGLVSKCGAAYPGGPTHILNHPPSKGGLVSSSREREGCSRTRPLKAKPCQVHDVTTTDTKPDLHHGCIPVGIAVARQRIQPYTPPLVSGDESRCLSGSAGSQVSCQIQSQSSCSQQLGGCTQPSLGCAQQALGCTQPLGCAQTTLGCTVQPTAPQLCASQAPTPWALPPPHHHWAHPPYQGVESCGLPPVGLQLHRDPMTGQLILLPNSVDNRGSVMWSGAPPSLQVMTPTQPLLLGDRFVALAHHDRRRPPNDHSPLAGVMVPCDFSKATGGTAGGREVSQQQVLIQQVPAGSQQVVLSSQLVEQSLGTSLVISNHQLSENTLTLSPHLVPVDTGFQPTATGLVISHTETNSFLRSDINTVFPVSGTPVIKEEMKPDITDTKNLVIPPQPQEVFSEPIEEKVELHKGSVADASNQTETPNVSDEDSSDKPLAMNIKEEKKDDEHHRELPQVIKTEKEETLEENVRVDTLENVDSVNCHDEPKLTEEIVNKEVDGKIGEQTNNIEEEENVQEGPDLSGLELLSNSIMQFGSRIEEECKVEETKVEVVTSQVEEKVEESSNVEEENKANHEDPMLGGLGLLCELAHLRFIEETQKEHCVKEVVEKNKEKVSEFDTPVIQVSVPPKKRPGRPRKSPNRVKNNRELPPVLEPAWSSNSSWSSTPALSPPTLSPHKRKPSPPALEEEESVGSPTVSSSKKRKVGRPRKRDDTPDQTETIVAKTNLMSSKAIVGLLLANQASNQASNQHKIRPKLKAETKVKDWRDEDEDLSPGKLESTSIISPTLKVPSYNPEPAKKKLKIKTLTKSTPVTSVPLLSIVPKKIKQCENNANVLANVEGPIVNKTKAALKEDPPCYYKGEKVESADPFSNKIILKKDLTLSPTKETKRLITTVIKDVKKEPVPVTFPAKEKSEVTVTKENVKKESVVPTKEVPKETHVASTKEINKSVTSCSKEVPKKDSNIVPKETPKKATETRVKKEEKKESHTKELRKSDAYLTSPKSSSEELTVPNASDGLNDPTFTMDHLSSLPKRVLFTLGGLLYAGQLTEVTPPDLYSVTLDKERGHKPHILATEQILTDTMLELKCEGMSLPIGTRLCAYWSQQYRCLYPGTLYEPASPSDTFVSVEFDDGDNGKINRNDVRLLPKDYPVSEYDPNPLHGISQRKRNNSSTSSDSHPKTESEEERRRLKRKKKKMELKKLLANESVWQDLLKYKRKHREQYKMRHKHKHKHRHKKHKHRRSRSCGERVVTEPEPIKPLIVKVHNLPPPEVKPEQKDDEEEEEEQEQEQEQDQEEEEEEQKVVKNKKNKTQKRDTSVQSKTEEPSAKPSPKKGKKERQGSIESKSKMAVFLPARQLWTWHGKGFKRGKGPSPRARKKIFYKSIKRQDEIISVGDCAVFLSTGRPDRPYIGKIEQMWECWGSTMLVKVSWFYHPEETIPKTTSLPFPGGLFESPHIDENDVQTISHKCDVLSFEEFKAKIDVCPELATNVYDNNDTYYLAGSYDPTHSNLTLLPEVKQN